MGPVAQLAEHRSYKAAPRRFDPGRVYLQRACDAQEDVQDDEKNDHAYGEANRALDRHLLRLSGTSPPGGGLGGIFGNDFDRRDFDV